MCSQIDVFTIEKRLRLSCLYISGFILWDHANFFCHLAYELLGQSGKNLYFFLPFLVFPPPLFFLLLILSLFSLISSFAPISYVFYLPLDFPFFIIVFFLLDCYSADLNVIYYASIDMPFLLARWTLGAIKL